MAMSDERLCALVANLVKDCEAARADGAKERNRLVKYYDGDPALAGDLPIIPNRSTAVSCDVKAVAQKLLPSVLRVIIGGDKIAEYAPKGRDDDKKTDQATIYVNYKVAPEIGLKKTIEDAVHDALKLRNGVLKWFFEERTCVQTTMHVGLSDEEHAEVVGDDGTEVLEHTARTEMVQVTGPDGQPQVMPIQVHDVKIRRSEKKRSYRVVAVPLEDFLCHPSTIDFETSPILGENTRLTRSDLISMGFDADRVNLLPIAGHSHEREHERLTRRDSLDDGQQEAHAMQEIDYYDLLVRVDRDGDGIAELRRLVFAGGLGVDHLFTDDEFDEPNYANVVIRRRPHDWVGDTPCVDAIEIQKIKTALLRQTLDNLYWQNMPQPIVQEGALADKSEVLTPEFGKPIRIGIGTKVQDAVGFLQVPFFAERSFGMLSYLDDALIDRTGVSDASGGMPSDALQNVTAKASAMIEQQGIGQTEMMVKTIAECLKPMFRGLLKLVVQYQDTPVEVRFQGRPLQFDPRSWNIDMDVSVNTGLGAGTRERDMMMLQTIAGMQQTIVQFMGQDNPLVSIDNVYNTAVKTIEAAGINNPDQYITKPDEQTSKAYAQKMAQKPSPEMEKAQAQAKAKEVEVQANMQARQAEMAMQQQADAAKLQQEMVLRREQMQMDGELKLRQMEMEINLKREQLAAELDLKRQQSMAEFAMRASMPQDTGKTSRVAMGGSAG